jgi:GNAT superfamily N-acetyltransferase
VIAELLALARAEARLPDPTAEMHDDVVYRWNESLPDSEVDNLHSAAFNEPAEGYRWRRARPLSLGWVTARSDSRLVGFANLAWDGNLHAFLLDVAVAPDQRRRGIGSRLVGRAIREARNAGCTWVDVDFDDQLAAFYESCGFVPSRAGLIRIE